ncbi:MAG: MerR family transcriptional regulator, partial [Desulfovibrio sp.]|nr:MerR family transcriptional regulator [Desulfovibrio sp.]
MGRTYKIGEAAALLNLKSYVLRFWETEFQNIIPLRTKKGQRLYTNDHLALLERIRYLLHERGLTIGGARKILAEEKSRGVSYCF